MVANYMDRFRLGILKKLKIDLYRNWAFTKMIVKREAMRLHARTVCQKIGIFEKSGDERLVPKKRASAEDSL